MERAGGVQATVRGRVLLSGVVLLLADWPVERGATVADPVDVAFHRPGGDHLESRALDAPLHRWSPVLRFGAKISNLIR